MTSKIRNQNVVTAKNEEGRTRQHHLPRVIDPVGNDYSSPWSTRSWKPPSLQWNAVRRIEGNCFALQSKVDRSAIHAAPTRVVTEHVGAADIADGSIEQQDYSEYRYKPAHESNAPSASRPCCAIRPRIDRQCQCWLHGMTSHRANPQDTLNLFSVAASGS
jgi:hypothetical protein